MDFIFHFILGLVISKNLLGYYSIWPVIFSLLPDIVGAMPYEVNKVYLSLKYKGNKLKKYISFTKRTKVFHNYQKIIYKSMHNLFAWLIITFLTKIVFPEAYLVLSLAYFLHLFFDSYTHEGDFSMQPFYPFKFSIKGKSWALNKKVLITNWFILILFLIYLRFR